MGYMPALAWSGREFSHDEMNRSTNLAERVRFGTFELNVRTGELISFGPGAAEAGSAKVLLREQPFQILRILVERQGKIVTRQEIKQILEGLLAEQDLCG